MNGDIAYVDSSAFVKLVAPEAETAALSRYLLAWPRHVSSSLLRVEALRAARRATRDAEARTHARLRSILLVAIGEEVLDLAARLDPPRLRALDAIHLATARLLETDLGVLITYDQRLAEAASTLGVPVASPA